MQRRVRFQATICGSWASEGVATAAVTADGRTHSSVAGRITPPNPVVVVALNTESGWWAGAEGATLVDMYDVFEPMKDLLIGEDGLHPTVDGYRKMAETLFEVIRSRLEETPGETAPDRLFGRRRWR